MHPLVRCVRREPLRNVQPWYFPLIFYNVKNRRNQTPPQRGGWMVSLLREAGRCFSVITSKTILSCRTFSGAACKRRYHLGEVARRLHFRSEAALKLLTSCVDRILYQFPTAFSHQKAPPQTPLKLLKNSGNKCNSPRSVRREIAARRAPASTPSNFNYIVFDF